MKKLLKYTRLFILVSALTIIVIVTFISNYVSNNPLLVSKSQKEDNAIRVGATYDEIEETFTVEHVYFNFEDSGIVYYSDKFGNKGQLFFDYQEFENYINFPKEANNDKMAELLRDKAEKEIRKELKIVDGL